MNGTDLFAQEVFFLIFVDALANVVGDALFGGENFALTKQQSDNGAECGSDAFCF